MLFVCVRFFFLQLLLCTCLYVCACLLRVGCRSRVFVGGMEGCVTIFLFRFVLFCVYVSYVCAWLFVIFPLRHCFCCELALAHARPTCGC